MSMSDSIPSDFPRTRAVVQQGITERLHLGAQVAIWRHGRMIGEFAVGEASPGKPLRNDHLLPWLSSSKPVAALAIAQLVEQGRMRLDDPVSGHLPEFGVGGKEAITLRHLLTHTAGFRAADQIPPNLPRDEMLARINATPLEAGWIPGEKAGYQLFSSWCVLGELLRRLTGLTFDRLARERVFAPLGIEDAWIGMTPDELEANRDRLAFLWNTFQGEPRPFEETDDDVLISSPGRSGRGPVHELVKSYNALLGTLDGTALNYASIVGSATLRAFTGRQRVGMYDHTFRRVMDWGFGFIPNPAGRDGEAVPYGYGPHASADAFGHGGAQSSCAFADPAHALAVAWICNGRPGEPRHQRRAWAINAAIYEDLGLAAGRNEKPG